MCVCVLYPSSLTLFHGLEADLYAGMAYRCSLDFCRKHGLQSQELQTSLAFSSEQSVTKLYQVELATDLI